MDKLNVEIKSSEIIFENLGCQEKGLLKKQLLCTAQYKSRMDIEFK